MAEHSPVGDTDPVPRIDVSALRETPADPPSVAEVERQMCEACAEIGFMTIVGHGISRSRVDALTDAAHRFFALPDAEKLAVAPRHWNPESPNVYRGYFPASVAGKEGLDVGDPELADPGLLARPYHEINQIPERLGGPWMADIAGYFDAISDLAKTVLRGLVSALGGDPARVGQAFARPASLSTLRFNFYPRRDAPVAIAADDGEPLSCEAHVDSGLLTLLHQDERGGLEVRDSSGVWRSIAPDPDAFVINTGLALQRMTGRALVATMHRVRFARRDRLSIPFFFEPIPDFEMSPRALGLPHTPPAAPPRYEDFLRRSLAKFSEYAR